MVNKNIIKIVKEYAKALKQNHIHYQKILLFGSQATKTTHPWSDIDVAVISNKFGRDRYEERVMLTKISSQIDPRIEPHPIGLYEFKNDSWESFIQNVISTGIEIAA